jgi:hypothetical protein
MYQHNLIVYLSLRFEQVRDKLRRFESNRAELLNCIMSAQGIQTLLDGQGEPYCSMLHTAVSASICNTHSAMHLMRM